MKSCKLSNPPIFFIGMPRSGTTILFEKFVESDEFGWLSNYSEMFPRKPAVNILCRLLNNRFFNLKGRKKQYGTVKFGNRYYPQAVEAYAFWDLYTRPDFSRDYLSEASASDDQKQKVCRAVRKTLLYQGKNRLVTKLTGPGRIAYLKSIFPDAKFIHVIRDGRAVVNSLMRIDFWRDKGGYEAPFWNNGLSSESLQPWLDQSHPAILAAVQWANIIRSIRQEADAIPEEDYIEIKYEDFVTDPVSEMEKLYVFAGIHHIDLNENTDSNAALITDMNKTILENLDETNSQAVEDVMCEMLRQTGYQH